MSHGKLRIGRVCLNCGAEVTGRYCSVCGQENIEPKQTVWHLITHFFSDITHFDGKFFVTVKDLFAKPGFLSREYMVGRRVSYLDPIRMYIFTSAFFFLIFFSIFDVQHMHMNAQGREAIEKDPELKALMAKAKTARDSLRILNDYNATATNLIKLDEDSTRAQKNQGIHFKVENGVFNTVEAYDSAQKSLPSSKRDGWIKKRFRAHNIQIKKRFNDDPQGTIKLWINGFTHEFPKVLFISLPLFALILKLLYVRRKQFYYVDHGIFSVHLYIFSFLVLLVSFAVLELQNYTRWVFLYWVQLLLLLYAFFYYYKAMRRFYGQGRFKTIMKYLLLLFLSFMVMLTIFIFAFFFTMLEI